MQIKWIVPDMFTWEFIEHKGRTARSAQWPTQFSILFSAVFFRKLISRTWKQSCGNHVFSYCLLIKGKQNVQTFDLERGRQQGEIASGNYASLNYWPRHHWFAYYQIESTLCGGRTKTFCNKQHEMQWVSNNLNITVLAFIHPSVLICFLYGQMV